MKNGISAVIAGCGGIASVCAVLLSWSAVASSPQDQSQPPKKERLSETTPPGQAKKIDPARQGSQETQEEQADPAREQEEQEQAEDEQKQETLTETARQRRLLSADPARQVQQRGVGRTMVEAFRAREAAASDPQTKAMHKVLLEEAKYRARMARINRLRELARVQGNEQRLAALDRLEQRVTELRDRRIAQANQRLSDRHQRALATKVQRGRPERLTDIKPGERRGRGEDETGRPETLTEAARQRERERQRQQEEREEGGGGGGDDDGDDEGGGDDGGNGG